MFRIHIYFQKYPQFESFLFLFRALCRITACDLLDLHKRTPASFRRRLCNLCFQMQIQLPLAAQLGARLAQR